LRVFDCQEAGGKPALTKNSFAGYEASGIVANQNQQQKSLGF
jgi:hypothetical protein